MSDSTRVQPSVDRCSGQNTGKFDPQKDDFVHGRYTPSKLFFDQREVASKMCCDGCVFGESYLHTCDSRASEAPC